MINRDDIRYMSRAIKLAKKAEGLTAPNPIVGAVVVKGGKIVGEGYHKKAGTPHAEVIAIKRAKQKTRGAALYVTLEPCDHFGRTPPCCDAIIASGIKNVKIAMKDPNPINNGRGIRKLKKHGIAVSVGTCGPEALKINIPYVKFIKNKMPFVTVKVAQSIDGKIATKYGESKWISGPGARRFVQGLRSKADAVMVGINTVLRDDPLLTVRNSRRKSPARIIVDSRLRIPLDSRLVTSQKKATLIVATTQKAPESKIKALRDRETDVIVFKDSSGRVPLRKLLRVLAGKGIVNILVEGGGELVGNLFDQSLVDRFAFIIANKIIGGKGSPTSVEGSGIDRLKKAASIKNLKIAKIGKDTIFYGEA